MEREKIERQRMLMIAMIGAVVGSLEGAAPFDLPAETPGRQGSYCRPMVGRRGVVEYAHVIAPRSDGNIYFPIDGRQPTTPEAAELSCANLDNREDSPITEWYMRMFGIIPLADGSANPQGIILFHENIDGTAVDDPSVRGAQIRRRALFEREFRKIAANPVGRMLLYRILIEIGRQRAGQPALEYDANIEQLNAISGSFFRMPKVSDNRNKARNLSIIWNPSEFNFQRVNPNYQNRCTISFNSKLTPKQVALGICGECVALEKQKNNLSVDLFHELLHWFHHLRDPIRFCYENEGLNAMLKDINLTDKSGIGGYFYDRDEENPKKRKISTLPWIKGEQDTDRVNLEEIRTIFGAPTLGAYTGCTSDYYYLEGDDISENVFRLSLNLPLRFGHNKISTYFEDTTFVNRAKLLAEESYSAITGKRAQFQIGPVYQFNLGNCSVSGLANSKFPNWVKRFL